jgi:hypothetical protein
MTFQTDTIARMYAEFGTQLPIAVITEIVDQCDGDLDGIPVTIRPEMLDRLSRQRLAFLDRPVAWIN